MKTILAVAVAALSLFATTEAHAQRRFLLPGLAAARLNRQAEANIALANLKASQQLVRSVSGHGGHVNAQFAFKAPHVHYAPRAVYLPSFAVQQQYHVAALPTYVPTYAALPALAPVQCSQLQCLPALQPAVQSYSASFSLSHSVGGGTYCGF